MITKKRMLIAALPLLAAIGLGVLNAMTPFASADQVTPTPDSDAGAAPQMREQNDAGWAVHDTTFQSDYPRGFTVTLTVESSGGPLEAA